MLVTKCGYIQPTSYAGPVVTMLPSSKVNSTHISAIFRCQVSLEHDGLKTRWTYPIRSQNCTTWSGGSLGQGNLDGDQVLAYVASTTLPVTTPSDPNSDFQEHDQFDFFGVDLSTAHSSAYSGYIASSSAAPAPTTKPASSTTTKPSSSTTTKPASSTTSSAPAATQTKVSIHIDFMYHS